MKMNPICLVDARKSLSIGGRWLLSLLLLLTGTALLMLPTSVDAQSKSKIDPLVMPSRKAPVHLITSGMLLDVARAGKRLVAVGERGHIVFSEDNGGTWQQAEVPVSVTLTGVYFPTALKGWAVGYDGVVLHTNDGGNTWALQLSDHGTIDLMMKAYESLLDNTKASQTSENEGNSELELKLEDMEFALGDWQNSKEEGVCPPFMGVWFKDDRVGMVYGAFGMMLRTEDAGTTWTPIIDTLDNFNGYHYYSLKPAGSKLFLVGEVGMIFRSDDLGKTWSRLQTPYEGSYFGIVSRENGMELVAFGLQGMVLRSADEGKTWHELAKASGNICGGITTTSGDSYLIGPDGTIHRLARRTAALEKLEGKFTDASTLIEAAPGKLICVGLKGIKTIQTNGTGG